MNRKLFAWILCLAMLLELTPLRARAQEQGEDGIGCVPIESVYDLEEGDVCTVMACDPDTGDWYAFADDQAVPVRYEDGKVSLLTDGEEGEGPTELDQLVVDSVEWYEISAYVVFSCEKYRWGELVPLYLTYMEESLTLSEYGAVRLYRSQAASYSRSSSAILFRCSFSRFLAVRICSRT